MPLKPLGFRNSIINLSKKRVIEETSIAHETFSNQNANDALNMIDLNNNIHSISYHDVSTMTCVPVKEASMQTDARKGFQSDIALSIEMKTISTLCDC